MQSYFETFHVWSYFDLRTKSKVKGHQGLFKIKVIIKAINPTFVYRTQ